MNQLLEPLTQIPPQIVSLSDYERLAPRFVTPERWAYISGGAMDERGMKGNEDSFHRWEIVPRVLADMTGAETAITLGEKRLVHPIMVAPMAGHRLFHPAGELATAEGAAAMYAGITLSCAASVVIEDVRREPGVPLWFQIYPRRDRAFMERLVRRMEAARCDALVVTVDAAVSGVRNRQDRAGFYFPDDMEAPNIADEPPWPQVDSVLDPRYLAELPGWEDIRWLRGITDLPLWIKGVVTPEDAGKAIEAGADGLIVSNHGGRTIDGLPSPLEVLPEIAQSVAGRVEIIIDGGIRRGTDIFIALALGANAVMVGRPILWGLSVAGALGVGHVLRILRHELEVTMLIAGCRNVQEMRGRVRRVAR